MFFIFFDLKKQSKSMFKLLHKSRENLQILPFKDIRNFTQKHIKSSFNAEKSLAYEQTLINNELFIKLT